MKIKHVVIGVLAFVATLPAAGIAAAPTYTPRTIVIRVPVPPFAQPYLVITLTATGQVTISGTPPVTCPPSPSQPVTSC